MRRLLIAITLIVGVIGLFVSTARAIGRTYPPSLLETVWQTYRCAPQPCWHDLQPGVTTLKQAKVILDQDQKVIKVTESGSDFGAVTYQMGTQRAFESARSQSSATSPAIFIRLDTVEGVLSSLTLSNTPQWLKTRDMPFLPVEESRHSSSGTFLLADALKGVA